MGQFNFMGQKLLYAVLLVCAVASPAQAQTAQKIAKKAFRSTVLLVMEDANGQPLALGSGFFVREGEIVSNLHVVEGASRGYAKLVGQDAKLDIQGITAIDAKRDLVILKVYAKTPSVLTLGDSEAAQVGEQIYAVGNPKGLEGTFSQGIISSVRDIDTDKLLQITAPISPGSSGGPVLNVKAEVIGVSVATFKGGQNLNFAIPSAYLKELLEKAGSVKPLASINPTKPKSSLVKNIGKSNIRGVTASHFAITAGGLVMFSLRNLLREPIKNIHYLAIYYDRSGNPLDFDKGKVLGPIPAGLAKRSWIRTYNSSLGKMIQYPAEQIEIRVLSFEIVQ